MTHPKKTANWIWLALFVGAPFAPQAKGADQTALKTIELEWEAVEKAGGYELRLSPVGGGKPLKFLTVESRIAQDVPIGTYKLQIRTRAMDEDYFSPWSEAITIDVVAKEITPLKPADGAVLEADETAKYTPKYTPKYTVEFEWKPVDNVKEYTLKVWNESRVDKPWVFVTRNTKKKLDVPLGEVYHWQVLFESANAINYQQAPTTFMFTVMGEKLTTPEIGPIILKPGEQTLAWRESPGATTYAAKLFYRHLDESDWTLVNQSELKSGAWSFKDLKKGAYRLDVTAKAARRTNSATAQHEFIVKPTDEEMRQALK